MESTTPTTMTKTTSRLSQLFGRGIRWMYDPDFAIRKSSRFFQKQEQEVMDAQEKLLNL